MRISVDQLDIIEGIVDKITEPTYLLECADGEDVDLITYAFATNTNQFFEMIVFLDGLKCKFTIVNEITADDYLDIVNDDERP